MVGGILPVLLHMDDVCSVFLQHSSQGGPEGGRGDQSAPGRAQSGAGPGFTGDLSGHDRIFVLPLLWNSGGSDQNR